MMRAQDTLQDDFREVGPWAQAVGLAFRFLFGLVCLIAVGWLFSNLRSVPSDSQAVILRFGAVARIQGAGLVLALPRPIETVVLVPAPARQIALRVDRLDPSGGDSAATSAGQDLDRDPRRNAGFLLTADGNVVHLNAVVVYQVSDPAAYVLQQASIGRDLQRIFVASAIGVIGRRDLDSVLVARPEIAARDGETARRERLRADVVNAMNTRLAALAAQSAGLGATIRRVDLLLAMPGRAKAGFDNVLVVTQNADTAVANARTAAQLALQDANGRKDKIATDSTAAADEAVARARSDTASIAALAQQARDTSQSMQMSRLYYERIGGILKKAGQVDAVDKDGGARTILSVGAAMPHRAPN